MQKVNTNTDDLDQELGQLPISLPEIKTPDLYSHSNNDVALEHYVLKLEKEGCTLCPLGFTSPKVVVSRGNLRSRLAIIGQNPGNQELVQGYPFVGPAGNLLDKMLEISGLDGAKPYFTNVGLCGTPDNRPLNEQEQIKCNNHWKTQILHLRPKVIIAVGKPSINTIVPTTKEMTVSNIVTQKFTYDNRFETIPVYTIYHPAFILRQDDQQKYIDQTVQKMQEIKDYLKSIPKPKTLF